MTKSTTIKRGLLYSSMGLMGASHIFPTLTQRFFSVPLLGTKITLQMITAVFLLIGIYWIEMQEV